MLSFEHLWSALLSLCAALAALFSFHIKEKLTDARAQIAKARAAAAEARTAALEAQNALRDHKLYASENYARQSAVNAAVDKLDARFDRVFDDLDEIKGRLPPKA